MLRFQKVLSDWKRPKTVKHSDLKNDVWQKTGGKCFYCGCVLLPFGHEKNSFSMDHVISLRKGGTDTLDNLVPSCRTCNSKKGAR